MKIKNLKINQKAASKLAAYTLVCSLAATSLTGCSTNDRNKNNMLRGTVLEGTNVVTLEDGKKDIVYSIDTCNDCKFNHYYSIATGEYFCDEDCSLNILDGHIYHHYKIASEESILSYLNSEEIAAASYGTLSKDDLVNIVTRVANLDSKEKVKGN